MKVKEILESHALFPKKRFSQSFIHSKSVIDKIVSKANIDLKDTVLEIGTGLGILTEALASRVDHVITYEIDSALVANLSPEIISNSKIEVVNRDFMMEDLTAYHERYPSIKVVANLPYHLSTEILFKLLEHRSWIESMTLMFQKEVAERIVAKPNTKAYGVLSVMTQLYSDPALCVRVARSCFYPEPQVDSAVVHFVIKKSIPLNASEEDLFSKIVKAGFGQRRKQLKKCLEKVMPKEKIEIVGSKVDLTRRLESFSISEIIDLCRH